MTQWGIHYRNDTIYSIRSPLGTFQTSSDSELKAASSKQQGMFNFVFKAIKNFICNKAFLPQAILNHSDPPHHSPPPIPSQPHPPPQFRRHCSQLELSLALTEHQSILSLRSRVSQSFWDLYLIQLWHTHWFCLLQCLASPPRTSYPASSPPKQNN